MFFLSVTFKPAFEPFLVLKFATDFLNLVMTGLVIYLSRIFVRKDDFKKYMEDTATPMAVKVMRIENDHDDRIKRIEFQMEMLPDKDTVHQLLMQIEKLTGKLEVYEERIAGNEAISKRMQTQLDLIDGYLRKAVK